MSGNLSQPHSLARERIQLRLNAAMMYPVTVIVAAAGYGKTTAIKQLLEAHQNYIFIQTPHLGSLQNFIKEFARSCSGRYAGMATPPEDLPYTNDNADEIVEICAAWALTHLENAEGLFVIDDLQFSDDEPAVAMFVSRIVDGTKGHLRWLLSTRTRANLPLTRWQAYGDSDIAITADDLRMTFEETHSFAESISCPATSEQLALWQKQTDGFPVSLTFAIRLSSRRASVDGVFDGTKALTFEFLADHLWASLTLADRQFLEVAALISEIHVHHFENAGLPAASRRAQRLSADIAFLSLSPNGTFAMHDLFRDFVLQRVDLSGPKALQGRRGVAALVLKHAKRYDDLLRLLIDSNDLKSLARLIEDLDGLVLDSELTRSIIDAFADVNIAEIGLGLLSRETEYWSFVGDWQRSQLYASEIFKRSDARSREILLAISSTYRVVNVRSASQQHEFLEEITRQLPRLDEPAEIQVNVFRAAIFARYESTHDEARCIIRDMPEKLGALGFRDRLNMEIAASNACYWLGDQGSALSFARSAVDSAMRAGDLREQAKTLNNLGIALLSSYDPELATLFEPARHAVESTGSWLFCHVSHWFPAFYFSLKGDSEAASHGRSLHSFVHPLEDSQRSLFQSIRRHSTNLARILSEHYDDVIRDSKMSPPAKQIDMQYALLVDSVVAHSFGSDRAATRNSLENAFACRCKLSTRDLHAVSESVLMEVVCLAASGQFTSARKLHAAGVSSAPSLNRIKMAIQIFCDGSPFTGLREALLPCIDQPFVGLTALLMQRLAQNIVEANEQIGVKLTAAETDVLKLLSLGKSNKAIADARSRSTETVKRQVAAIYKKLGVENRTSALAAAKELGIV